MKHFKLKLAAVLIVALGLVGLPKFVYAQDGSSGGSGDGQPSQTSTDSSEQSDTATAQKTSDDSQTEQERERQEVEKARTEGHNFLVDLETKHGRHTEEQRKKNCQAAEHGLETKLANIQKNAASFKNRIDAKYQKALDIQAANNLNPTGIDQLEATADAAKATAAASVAALSGLSVNLDCTSPTVAENVATLRSAAKQVRTDLLAYKKAVKAVLNALEGEVDNG